MSEKASYLYTAILGLGREDLLAGIKDILSKNGVAYSFKHSSSGASGDGYIDHVHDLGAFVNICNDEKMLMKYLFSSRSFILTGNDNDDHDVEICVDYAHEEYNKGN